MKYETSDYFRFINALINAAMRAPYAAQIPSDALVEMSCVLQNHYNVAPVVALSGVPECVKCDCTTAIDPRGVRSTFCSSDQMMRAVARGEVPLTSGVDTAPAPLGVSPLNPMVPARTAGVPVLDLCPHCNATLTYGVALPRGGQPE